MGGKPDPKRTVPRRVTQIVCVQRGHLVALAHDGSIWERFGATADSPWEQLSGLPEAPACPAEKAWPSQGTPGGRARCVREEGHVGDHHDPAIGDWR